MSEMTESTSAAPAQPAKPVSFWEDVIEIFVHPADVMRRRADGSVWPPLLFVTIAIGVITFATYNLIVPIVEAEFARSTAKLLAKNPQITQEILDKQRDMAVNFGKYIVPVVILLTMFMVGVFTWLVSKLVSAKTTFNQA